MEIRLLQDKIGSKRVIGRLTTSEEVLTIIENTFYTKDEENHSSFLFPPFLLPPPLHPFFLTPEQTGHRYRHRKSSSTIVIVISLF